MTLAELQKSAFVYGPALAIERWMPLPARIHFRRTLGFLSVFFLVCTLVYSIFTASPELAARFSISAGVVNVLGLAEGLLYIALAFYLALFSINVCYLSYSCRGVPLLLREPRWGVEPPLSFDAAVFVSALTGQDVFKDFSESALGKEILWRLGISRARVKNFLERAHTTVTSSTLAVQGHTGAQVRLDDIVAALFSADEASALFLAEQGASAHSAREAARWVERTLAAARRARRVFGREQLGRIPGLGKDWGYGAAWRLARYGRTIAQSPVFTSAVGEVALAENTTEQIEAILSRAREANALVVGDAGSPREASVLGVALRIAVGSVFPPLEHKQIIILDTTSLIAETKTKPVFEAELLRIFSDIEAAGNLVVVIPDFAEFIESAEALGSNLAQLLDAALASPRIQLIALAETSAFYRSLEPNAGLIKRFERILVPAPTARVVLPFLEDEALRLEAKFGLFCTLSVVEAAIAGAERYFMGAPLLDKATDLLYEAATEARKGKRSVISSADIFAVVEKRSGVPAGHLGATERTALLELESTLRRRVIGQDEALAAVAGALRRARGGVGNPNRPFGSFLFLGPTGVGKTETAKALAASFFGSESSMHRLDLSEYKTADALERLIGSFRERKPGTLSSLLRERQYGVLLLDEFEKTSVEIRHLFLQVLDEGFFTDAGGKRVNCRNLLIIATSNAGSDLIWSAVGAGENLADEKKRIVNTIVVRGDFSPELLNRFDGVILFQPLVGKNLRAVADLMLKKLATRMEERGIFFTPTQRLVDFVAEAESDKQFGARAMQRTIADTVERSLADKILRGELRPGQRVELSPEEFHV